jgi:RNA polymerase sigma factor (sigma-70 family)
MRLPEIPAETLAAARAGQLVAIDAILGAMQPGVFNLAIRMLGHREDARDATQEILLKVVTHLGTLREDARFGPWVFQVARNHLLTARTRRRESPEVSLEAIGHRLEAGLAASAARPAAAMLTPEDKAAAREVAVLCTQGMLMALDRPHRLAWLLDVVFGLDSDQAAEVAGITPAAHRKRLSRARAELRAFTGSACGLANPAAACRCEWQLPASRAVEAAAPPPLRLAPRERAEAIRRLDRLGPLTDAAALFRAHPDYRAPAAMAAAIRAVLRQEGLWADGPPKAP